MTAPYSLEAANHIYNLLFCDDPSLFANPSGADETADNVRVLAPDASAVELRKIADDPGRESRTRALAFNRLREIGEGYVARILLGTVIEISMEHGLDTLAVFADHRVRYINQTTKMAFFEKPLPSMEGVISALLAASRAAVDRIGPAGEPRQPPPPKGSARITFIVSDGLYFGHGPFAEFSREPAAAPIFQQGGLLLRLITDAVVRNKH